MVVPPFNEQDRMAVITALGAHYTDCRINLRKEILAHSRGHLDTNWRNAARQLSRARRAIIHAEKTYGFSPLPTIYNYPRPVPVPVVPDPFLSDDEWEDDPF